MKLAFFTGARSEYGVMKKLLHNILKESSFDISIIAGGMHLLKKYGYTISEIEKDKFPITAKLGFYDENIKPNNLHFTKAINKITKHLLNKKYDAIFIIGDRLEAYAAALAAHFSQTPVIHFAGGTLTQGAVDNIYRYNITNLATFHFATSKGNFQRLLSLPTINKNNVFFTGSIAVDAIVEFQNRISQSIENFIPGLNKDQFVLITFHSATNRKESLPDILKHSVDFILEKGYQVLITYPNNDPGAEDILKVIREFLETPNVFVRESLGAKGYYTALNDCFFVLGNSSSGIIEAPYFNKITINVGTRQEGREVDENVLNVEADVSQVTMMINRVMNEKISFKNHNIYGSGKSIEKIISILKSNFR